MFTKITNPANPLRTENFLRPYKRGEKELTPEVARQVLTMTNHKKNICDTLQLIASQQNQAQYKEIILSAFDHREQPDETIILGKKLAFANGFENELNTNLNHDYVEDEEDGIIYASAANQIAAYVWADNRPDISQYHENISLYCISPNVDLSSTDLSPVKSLKFKEGTEVYLIACTNLPADLDVSMCNYVDLSYADLSNIKSLKFKEGADVDLSFSENLPADLDVSRCRRVILTDTDLSSVKSLKFKEGADVNLSFCKNLPADLDVSMCDKVNLTDTDLSSVKSLKFKEDAEVILFGCENLPETLDVSMCREVDLSYTDPSSVKSLKFKENAEVDLYCCKSLPADVDVSMCKRADLTDTDLSTVQSLKFKNKQQEEQSAFYISDNWQGKIIYTDDIQPANAFTYTTQNTGR